MKEKNIHKSAMLVFMIGVFMGALDNGIISAALTTINANFGVDANVGTWGITLYTLGLAVSVPIVGKLSDKYGRKKLFLIEVAIFGLGSLLVALSPNYTFFLVARLLQSLGGGGIFIIASSYVLTNIPKERQGAALGMLGGMNGIAAILGPNVGAMLLSVTGNWHWLFLINVPIALFLLYFGWKNINESRATIAKPLDFFGTILIAISVVSLMFGITNIKGGLTESLTDWKVSGFIVLGILMFGWLLVHAKGKEQKNEDPVIPYSLVVKPTYILTVLVGMLSGTLLAAVIFVPAFVEQFLGVNAEQAGYWMTPLALASGIGATFGGRIVDKKGPVTTVRIAAVISLIGFSLFPLWVDSLWQFVIASMISGVGFSMLLGAPLNVLATESAGENKGSALATLSLFRTIGMTLAPTIYGGFLGRNLAQTSEIMRENFSQAGYTEQQIGALFAQANGEVSEMISSITDPEIVQIAQQSVHEAVGNGYTALFGSAAVASIAIFIVITVLGRRRAKQHAIE
ncbi:MAG: MFS transporter [Bacilli bacterium]